MKSTNNIPLCNYQKYYEETAGGDTLYFAKILALHIWERDRDANAMEHMTYKLYIAQYSDQTRETQISLTDTGILYTFTDEEPPGYYKMSDMVHDQITHWLKDDIYIVKDPVPVPL